MTYGEQKIKEEEARREVIAQVHEQFPNVTFPEPTKEPLFFGKLKRDPVPGNFVTVDANTKTPWAVVTDEYQIIHHEEIIGKVLSLVKEIPEYGQPEFNIHLMQNGAKMNLTVQFPEHSIEVRKGDAFNPNIQFRNSYDAKWRFGYKFGAFRLVCSNGMIAGVIQNSMKARHLQSLDFESVILDHLKSGMVSFSEQNELWKKWAEKQIEIAQFEKISEVAGFSPVEVEKLKNLNIIGDDVTVDVLLQENRLTAWDAHNAMTQFATHEVRSELRKLDLPVSISNSFSSVLQ